MDCAISRLCRAFLVFPVPRASLSPISQRQENTFVLWGVRYLLIVSHVRSDLLLSEFHSR